MNTQISYIVKKQPMFSSISGTLYGVGAGKS